MEPLQVATSIIAVAAFVIAVVALVTVIRRGRRG